MKSVAWPHDAHYCKNGRQKLVRREKITLPGLKRQKQLVWNLACLSEKSFQPEVQVKEGTDRVIVDQRDKGSLPDNEAKINIFGTRAVSRFIRNCRSQIASARFCLCSRYTSHLSSLLLFYHNHEKRTEEVWQGANQWDTSIYHTSHSFYLLQLNTILEQLKCFEHLLMDGVYVKEHLS